MQANKHWTLSETVLQQACRTHPINGRRHLYNISKIPLQIMADWMAANRGWQKRAEEERILDDMSRWLTRNLRDPEQARRKELERTPDGWAKLKKIEKALQFSHLHPHAHLLRKMLASSSYDYGQARFHVTWYENEEWVRPAKKVIEEASSLRQPTENSACRHFPENRAEEVQQVELRCGHKMCKKCAFESDLKCNSCPTMPRHAADYVDVRPDDDLQSSVAPSSSMRYPHSHVTCDSASAASTTPEPEYWVELPKQKLAPFEEGSELRTLEAQWVAKEDWRRRAQTRYWAFHTFGDLTIARVFCLKHEIGLASPTVALIEEHRLSFYDTWSRPSKNREEAVRDILDMPSKLATEK